MKGNFDIKQMSTCASGRIRYVLWGLFLAKSIIKPLSQKMCGCYLLLVTVDQNKQVPTLYVVDLFWGLSP